MKNKYNLLLLIGIVLLASFLRLYHLSGYPPSFWQDIAANGYDAYSILTTGKDQWGTFLPFPLIKSLGDYKTALPVYFLIPGIKIFGLNEFGVRINMAIIGILTVILSYFVGKKFGKSEIFGLILAFLLAISPWHIGLVRHGWEGTLGILFFLLGFHFMLSKKYLFSIIFWGVASYSYHPFRIFVPLFLAISFYSFYREKKITKTVFLLNLLIFFVIFIPNLLSFLNPTGRVRIEVNRFDKTADFFGQLENNSSFCFKYAPDIICHKDLLKTFTWATFAFKNYFRLFSFDFLFVWGSSDPVFEIKERGVIYFWMTPLLFLGLYTLIKRRNLVDKLLLFWLVLWPIPIIIVNNPYNLVKTAHLLLLLEIITTMGIVDFVKSKIFSKYKLLSIYCLLFIVTVSVSKYFVDYYATYPLYSSSWYQGIEKNTFLAIDRQKENFSEIILSQKLEPYIYLLFYEKIDPAYYQNSSDKEMVMVGKYGEAHLKRLGKFRYSTGIEKDIKENILYAFPPEEIPSKGFKPVIYKRIKDILGNVRIVVFSLQKI